MKWPLNILVMLMMAAVTAYGAETLPSDMERFLNSRKVLGTVLFDRGSAALSRSARQEIDRLVPFLKKMDSSKAMIRVEGFSSPDGSEDINVPLSMLRAKAVIDYLKLKYKLELDLYLTGYSTSGRNLSAAKSGRAELAVYDGALDFDQDKAKRSIIK